MSTVVDKIKTRGTVVRGSAVMLRGKAKEKFGSLTGNRRLQAEGMADQGVGRLKRGAVRLKSTLDAVTRKIRR